MAEISRPQPPDSAIKSSSRYIHLYRALESGERRAEKKEKRQRLREKWAIGRQTKRSEGKRKKWEEENKRNEERNKQMSGGREGNLEAGGKNTVTE